MMQLEKLFVRALGQIEEERRESGSIGERQRREGGERVRERRPSRSASTSRGGPE